MEKLKFPLDDFLKKPRNKVKNQTSLKTKKKAVHSKLAGRSEQPETQTPERSLHV